VSTRAGLDRWGKFRLHRDSIAGPSSPQPVAIPTELLGPHRVREGNVFIIQVFGMPE